MKKLYCLIITILLFSCSKELDPQEEGFLMSETEVVNGMTVHWQNYMTEERRQVIRDILNDMVLVEGGIFTMGTSWEYDSLMSSNETPQHIVKLSDYYICARELTKQDVYKLMSQEFYFYPSWDNWNEILTMLCNMTDLNFDFPTEAQWEYAARGGHKSKGYLFPGSNEHSKVWSAELEENNTSIPNELGLYNMADKYSEWCKDYYQTYSNTTMEVDPCVMYGRNHVIRGGSYESSGEIKGWKNATSLYCKRDWRFCRSTARNYGVGMNGCRPVLNISK